MDLNISVAVDIFMSTIKFASVMLYMHVNIAIY